MTDFCLFNIKVLSNGKVNVCLSCSASAFANVPANIERSKCITRTASNFIQNKTRRRWQKKTMKRAKPCGQAYSKLSHLDLSN